MEDNQRLPIFKPLMNFFNAQLHKKHLIILIGRNGITFSAFKGNVLIDSIFFIYNADDLPTKSYKDFFKKHQSYQVTIILDTDQCTFKHETLPILNSIIKVNPALKYIDEHFSKSDIIAYNVYNISTENGEIWETSIATIPYANPLKNLLGFIIRNSLKFHGIYFLSLEFQSIIEGLIVRSGSQFSKNSFQILVIVTKSSDIRIALKHKQNIMDESTTPYPFDKSDLYVQGTIEQIINDKLLTFKSYINGLQLKVNIFVLCNDNLKDLFNAMKIDSHKVITLSAKDVSYSLKPLEEKFQDNLVLELFNEYKNFRAFNSKLKLITKLTFLNSIIFKPLIALIILLVITIVVLEYKTLQIQKNTVDLNAKYYSLSEEYRNIKKKYPEIINVSNLADLYNYETSLNASSSTPFDDIKGLLTLSHPQIDIMRLKWELKEDSVDSLYAKEVTSINIDIEYNGKSDMENGINLLNVYINKVKTIFQDYDVKFEIDHKQIVQLPKKLIIPAHVTISNKFHEQQNVR